MQLSAIERHYTDVLAAGEAFFAAHAPALASACWGMARRFHRGGRLPITAPPGPGFSDARHIAVEFIHPVPVGKRALPAISVRERAHLDLLAGPHDVRMEVSALGLGVDGDVFAVETRDRRSPRRSSRPPTTSSGSWSTSSSSTRGRSRTVARTASASCTRLRRLPRRGHADRRPAAADLLIPWSGARIT